MMLSRLYALISKKLPEQYNQYVYKIASNFVQFLIKLLKPYFYYRRKKYTELVNRIRQKDKINVIFLLIHESIWKYDYVYNLFSNDKRYNTTLVICPDIINGAVEMYDQMEKAYFNYSQKGYNTIRTFNKEKNVWVNIKKELQPDVVFFTNPHRLTKSQYYIFNFLDCLTCYVPYAFVIIKSLHLHYNQLFQNLLWKAFYETEVHRNFAINIAANNGVNVIVTGYPGIDKLIDKKYTPTTDPWKIKDRKLKRIIWAPHHSIHGDGSDLDYSNFLTYADFMLGIANKYSDKIQIAFKPHPLLKSKLIKNPDWGLNKTEEYYKTWDKLPNGIKNESDYIDLFLTSDAMIHDSASFMVEYLYTQKAVLFMKRDESIENRFNEFGRLVFQNLYQADNETEIIRFIEEKVLLDKDDMEPQRIQFIKNVLIPPHNQSASENIYYAILKELEPN